MYSQKAWLRMSYFQVCKSSRLHKINALFDAFIMQGRIFKNTPPQQFILYSNVLALNGL